MSRCHQTRGSRDPIADWAASGVVPLTGPADGPPVSPPGAAATAAARLADCFEALARAGGRDVRLDGAALLAERAAFTGLRRAGPVSVGAGCRLLAAADGLVAASLPRADDPALVGAVVGRADVAAGGAPAAYAALAGWAAIRPVADVVAATTLLGLAVSGVGGHRPGRSTAADLVLAAAAAPADHELVSGRRARPVGTPLVVDFSALWAGPLCAQLLGLAGGEVVKIETSRRPDGARSGNRAFYDLLHAGHLTLQVDPTDPADRALLGALVARADVVVEASRPRALAGWGLSTEAAVRAGTVWVSITAYGRDGAAGERIGFGDDVAAGAGLVAASDDPPGAVFCGDALADPLTGLTAAVLALDALSVEGGRLVDVAMADVVGATLDGTASQVAVARAAGWWLEAEGGPVPVRDPRARPVPGRAAEPGADTARVRGWLESETAGALTAAAPPRT